MSTFYVLDHSLKNAGGHHYDYARCILHVAQQAGLRTILATHRRFRELHAVPEATSVLPVFPHHTYSRFSVQCGWRGGALGLDGELISSAAGQTKGKQGGWFEGWQRITRRRQIEGFAGGCRASFEQAPPQPGEHVFLPTLSEFDLLGLVNYLQAAPESRAWEWHLQFHFPLLVGRDPEFATQKDRLTVLRRQFDAALSRVPEHRLHFYTTTEVLARQYNLLEVAPFEPLTYPIDHAFHPPRTEPSQQPLRITSAGAIRREKGQQFLSQLVSELWTQGFSCGKWQLAIQCKPSKFLSVPRRVVHTPERLLRRATFRHPAEACIDKVMHVRHPLPSDDYRQLIRHADIGLFLYDGRTYYSRHAGVLGEYLSAGVPVIVPAGCWLADQIEEPIQEHLESLYTRLADGNAVAHETMKWQLPGAGRFNQSDLPAATLCCSFPVMHEAGDLLISVRDRGGYQPGHHLRLDVQQWDLAERLVHTSVAVVAARSKQRRVHVLTHLKPGCETVRIGWSYAYRSGTPRLADVSICGLPGDRQRGGSHPAGSVGLIASEHEQVADLLRDMCRHHAHYRRTAQAFSRAWHAGHAPERTFQKLCSKAPEGSLPWLLRAA